MMFVDCFSVGIDELNRKQQGDIAAVLRILDSSKRFSAFEASANDTIARTMTVIMKDGYAKSIGGTYPWTKVEITDKGRAFLSASQSQPEGGEKS